MREVGDRNILDKFAEDFARVVETHCKYIIVSGFVAISHGRTRGTEDIDMIIERVGMDDFESLHKDLEKSGFECIQSNNPEKLYNEYLSNNTSIRYVEKGKFVPEMELKLAKDKLDEYQIRTRTKLEKTGLDLYFSSIETNIAFKEELLKSKKDIEDAKHLRILYEEDLNEDEIGKVKKMIRELRL